MNSRVFLAALLPLLTTVGCLYVPVGSLPKLTVENAAMLQGLGKGEIKATPQFSTGNLKIQSVVSPYAASDVEHLVLKLFMVKDGTEMAIPNSQGNPLTKDIAKADLNKPVSFVSLHFDTNYRIRAFAYKATGTATADLISLDASSSVDVAVAKDDRPVLANIPVQLTDKAFSGQATASNVVITPGNLVNGGAEDIL